MIEWGRCYRGRVWHLLDRAAGGPWCGSADPIIEWTQGQPPLGGRPCPRCCSRVRDISGAVSAAVAAARHEWIADAVEGNLDDGELDEELEPPRSIETVDLVGALADRQAELRLRDEGPDPQADELPDAEAVSA